jgi:hypothetical protein
MIQRRNWITAVAAAFFLCGFAQAQLDLAALQTQTVKQNQPWASINTKVNELHIDISINRGIVTTSAEFAFTPDSGMLYNGEIVCDPITNVCEEVPQNTSVWLDSLETRAWFYLDDNTAVTELYLWVGDEKVRAYLQERELASAQYESIVERRRDPALLETWGGGSYSLKVFPLESGQIRRVEIQFVQGLEDNPDGFSTTLPIMHSLSQVYYPGVDNSLLPYREIGTVTLSAQSLDGKTYSLSWEGLDTLTVSPARSQLTATGIQLLGAGVIKDMGTTSSSNAWTGWQGGKSYFGVKSMLIYDELDLEPEPASRLFILDVPSDNTIDLERARKLALMSIKTYVQEGQSFNVGLVGASGQLSFVFNIPRPASNNSLRDVYQALVAWSGSPEAHSLQSLEQIVLPRSAVSPMVVFMISGQHYVEYTVPNPASTGNPDLDKTLAEQWQAGYDAWYQEHQDRVQRLADACNLTGIQVFGFWNDYLLTQVATATGGYQLGSLTGTYYWYAYSGDPAVNAPDRMYSDWYLPPLYGPGRPWNSGPQNIEVATSGVTVQDLVVLTGSDPYYYGGGMDIRRMDYMYPYYWSPDSVPVRISGIYQNPGMLNLTITGTWDGLAFSRSLSVYLPMGAGGSSLAASLYAYQKSESLRIDDYMGSIQAIKDLGRQYHVVNSQMSLLALEPGMELWDSLPTPEQGAGGREAGANFDASMALPPGSETNIDNLQLEDILNATGIDASPARSAGLSMSILTASDIRVLLTGLNGSEEVKINIIDLTGKLAAELTGRFTGSGYEAVWAPQARTRGLYLVVAEVNGSRLVRKLVLKE